MRVCLGAASQMNATILKEEYFQTPKLFHCEGYCLYNGDLLEEAMKMAKKQGCKISLDLSSFEIVRTFKEKIISLLKDWVDVVFCNKDEAIELCGSAEGALEFLSTLCDVVVITMGSAGSYVKSGSSKFCQSTTPVQCVDATGAGDLFAAGFLYGWLQNFNLRHCCKIGNLLGGTVIQTIGAQVPDALWDGLMKQIQKIEQKDSLKSTRPSYKS